MTAFTEIPDRSFFGRLFGRTIRVPAGQPAASKPPSRQLIEADLQMMGPGHSMVYTTQLVRAAFGDLANAEREIPKLGGTLTVHGGTCVIERNRE